MRDPLYIRLLGLLLWLFPPSFRRRYGAAVVAAARLSTMTGQRRRRAWVVVDAMIALVRAWFDVLGNAARTPLHPGRIGGAVLRDAAIAMRNLRRRPLDGLIVVLTLGVALGANVAIYSVTHALLVATLPYAEPERIMEVSSPPLDMMQVGNDFSWKVGRELGEHFGVEAVATYYPEAGANLVDGSSTSRVRITQVSPSFFQVLGVRMLLGHGLAGEEAGDRAILSHELWRTAFGGDRDVIGRTIQLSGRAYVIAGVAPEEVDFPDATQLWLTDPPVGEFYAGALGPSVIARLRRGARAAVETAMARHGESERQRAGREGAGNIADPQFTPLRDRLVQPIELPLLVLSGAAGLVLLLGCVNVAGVTLARFAGRREELLMRCALGASRTRLFGQLLTELGVVAVLAGLLSTALALALVPLLVGILPAGTPRLESALRPGEATFLFAAAATVFAALAAGLPPAIVAARGASGFGYPGRVRAAKPVRMGGHAALTTIQVALAFMLVVAASLLGRTLAELRAVSLGYDTERVLTFEVHLPEASYASREAARIYLGEVLSRVSALPGVESAGAIDRLPLSGSMGIMLPVQRTGTTEQARVMAGYRRATHELFDALGIRLLAGRTFSTSSGGQAEAIISAQLARRLFGDAEAIGQSIEISPDQSGWDATVVGVVDDVRFRGAESEIEPAFYHNLAPSPRGRFNVAVRSRGEPAALATVLRSVLAEVDPHVPPYDMKTTGAAALETIAARRAVAIVAALFGVAALGLAVLALYGMLAQGVAMRRRELGLRLALGAPVGSIEGMVVRRGLSFTAAGVALGLLLSIAVTQLLEGMLFGVGPRDNAIMAITAVLVLSAALIASWLPARRAGRTDPMTSLRAT